MSYECLAEYDERLGLIVGEVIAWKIIMTWKPNDLYLF